MSALQHELKQRNNELEEDLVQTIYWGGGTPSVLAVSEIEILLKQIGRFYTVDPVAEITMECNPDDLDEEYLKGLKEIGINRLSIGIQSFSDYDLELMDRRHRSAQAIKAVKMAQKSGFQNISIDLIYGLPGQSANAWKQNIEQAIELGVQHISAYHLTYHKGTIFYEWMNEGKLSELPENVSFEQFRLLKTKLEKAGYEQYEISNFAREGQYSRHNISYWQQEKYLGIGPSAHSFDLKTRRWNIANLQEYIHKVESGEKYWEHEILTEADRYNDYIITRLRTKWGISTDEIKKLFADKFVEYFVETCIQYITSGHMRKLGTQHLLTTEGLFISDKIMEDLIWVEE